MDKEALIESMSHPENLVDDIEDEIELRIPSGIIVEIELASPVSKIVVKTRSLNQEFEMLRNQLPAAEANELLLEESHQHQPSQNLSQVDEISNESADLWASIDLTY